MLLVYEYLPRSIKHIDFKTKNDKEIILEIKKFIEINKEISDNELEHLYFISILYEKIEVLDWIKKNILSKKEHKLNKNIEKIFKKFNY